MSANDTRTLLEAERRRSGIFDPIPNNWNEIAMLRELKRLRQKKNPKPDHRPHPLGKT